MTKKQRSGRGMSDSKTPFGALIRQKRLKLGMTQVALASAVSISQRSVSMYEIGNQMPPRDRLERLARALNCPIEELQKFIPSKPLAQPTTELGRLIRSRSEELDLSMEDVAREMRVSVDAARMQLDLRKSPYISVERAAQLVRILQFDPAQLAPFLKANIQSRSPLGRIVSARRIAFGMSMESLGKKLGISRQHVHQIEIGRCSLSNSDGVFQRLVAALKLDVRELQAVRPIRRQKKVDRSPIAQWSSHRRRELHLTQHELARRARVGQSTISMIETGKHHPSDKLLRRIMEVLGLSASNEAIAQLTQTSHTP